MKAFPERHATDPQSSRKLLESGDIALGEADPQVPIDMRANACWYLTHDKARFLERQPQVGQGRPWSSDRQGLIATLLDEN